MNRKYTINRIVLQECGDFDLGVYLGGVILCWKKGIFGMILHPPPLLILILKEQMSFTEKWDKAFDARDRDALAALLDDEFVFVRHQSGKEIPKEDMLNIWTSDGPRYVFNNYRVIYENDDIVVTHRFIDFPSGDKEAVLGVINLKNGKGIRMETGATPMPS